MCGIIGYIGSKPPVPVLMEGLRRMEYRGYDSAGIAVVDGNGIALRRSAGKLANLESTLQSDPVDGSYGVAHTRWATHGRPTQANAHPHRDCSGRLVVVHNGIIENYLELKRDLQRDGHEFTTETDSEIVAHLVEQQMRGDGLEAAVRRAVAHLRGMYAIVLVSADDPGRIVAVRSGPPIVVGIGDNEHLVASDLHAILSHTRDVVFLGDDEMAVITRTNVRFYDLTGAEVSKPVQRVLWDAAMSEKGGHRHFMLKEIHEQPAAIRETLAGRVLPGQPRVFLDDLNVSDDTLRAVEKVSILACGTSWHAALIGKYLIEAIARMPVDVDYGSEYRYRDPIVSPATLTIAITQSGETADTLAALREARRHGAPSIAICNVPGSQVTRDADGTIYTHAGPEIGVASTKAFTAQLVALHLLALHLGRVRDAIAETAALEQIDALLRLPQYVDQAIEASARIDAAAERFTRASDFLFIGRGINYPVALEGALKLKEISYIHAEGYPAGEMKHGPIALIDDRMPVVALAPADHLFEKMIGNIQEAKARGAAIIAITTAGDTRLDGVLDPRRDVVIPMPDTPALLAPVVLTIPLQLLAYQVATRRGCDVDQPRNLAKSVTVE